MSSSRLRKKSLSQEDIFNFSAENGCKIILPQDANVALKIENNVSSNIKKVNQIDMDEMILDIGPVSIKELKEQKAETRHQIMQNEFKLEVMN